MLDRASEIDRFATFMLTTVLVLAGTLSAPAQARNGPCIAVTVKGAVAATRFSRRLS